MHIQLRPKVSHRHILPVVVLYILAISVGDPGGIWQCDWLSAAAGLLVFVIVGITSFYALLPFIYMADLKESWVGTKSFGFCVPQTATSRTLVRIGILLTYYAFVCRVFLISVLEAAFLGIVFLASTGSRLNPIDRSSWTPYWLLPLAAFIVTVHTWFERTNLGKAGLCIGMGPRKSGSPP
jgi:hypothetical protein